MNESARLIHGDCLDPKTGLASLPERSFDHVITDPPYSEHVHGNARSTDGKVHSIEFSHLSPSIRTGIAQQTARLVRRWVLVFCDVEGAHLWRSELESAGLEYVRTGFWNRVNSMPQITGDRPAAAVEAIVIAHRRGRKQWNGGGKSALWAYPLANDTPIRLHPTQKPLALMEALIRDFTDPGDIICDPFAGSGTTGVAAVHLGRRFIGWERDEKYARIAQERIGSTREQIPLFTETPPAKQAGLFAADSEDVA